MSVELQTALRQFLYVTLTAWTEHGYINGGLVQPIITGIMLVMTIVWGWIVSRPSHVVGEVIRADPAAQAETFRGMSTLAKIAATADLEGVKNIVTTQAIADASAENVVSSDRVLISPAP